MNQGLLEQIRIRAFQSHADTSLMLVPGMNVIVGSNDTGKTAVLRAVKSVIYFDSMYLRSGETECYVGLVFSDGCVSRQREEKKGKLVPGTQVYIVDGEQEKKLGRTLPEKIADMINMARVEFEDGTSFSLNMAEQIPQRGPFLIGSGYNGATRVKILGSVTEQHLFDEGARAAKNDGRRASGEVKTLEKLLREAQEARRAIDEEPRYQDIKRAAERLVTQSDEVGKRLECRRNALTRLRDANELLGELRAHGERLPPREEINSLCERGAELADRIDHHAALVQAISRWHREVRGLRENLARLPDLSRVAELLRSAEDIRGRRLRDLSDRLRSTQQRLASLRDHGPRPPDAVRGLLARASEISLRQADRTKLLHRYRDSSEAIEGAREHCRATETRLTGLRFEVAEMLHGMKMCPYAPVEVQLQDACRKKFRV
jgi:chromosome segregation ATPase